MRPAESGFILERTDDTAEPHVLLHDLNDRVSFHHAPDDAVRMALLHAMRGIGQHSGEHAVQLLDALLSFLPGEGAAPVSDGGAVEEWLVLINQVMVGMTLSSCDRTAVAPYLILALDTFVQPSLFAPTQRPAVLTLLLAGVATIAFYLGEEFRQFLMHALFPLLSHLGSSSVVVSSAAMNALRVIAAALSYASVSVLVMANVDYVVDAIAAHLLSSHPTPQLLLVMRAVLSRLPPSPQLIPLLHDTLDSTIRLLSVPTGDEEQRVVCAEVLLGVVVAVRRLYEVEKPPAHPSSRSGLFDSAPPIDRAQLLLLQQQEADGHFSAARVRERLRRKRERCAAEDVQHETEAAAQADAERQPTPEQWFAQQEARRERREERRAMGLRDEDTDSDDDDDARAAKQKHREWRQQERKDEDVQPTAEQAVVIGIMKQARSWLGRGTVREQVLVLELVKEAIVVLRTIPKDLFPLIAQMWPSVLALIRRYHRSGTKGSTQPSLELALPSPRSRECGSVVAERSSRQRQRGRERERERERERAARQPGLGVGAVRARVALPGHALPDGAVARAEGRAVVVPPAARRPRAPHHSAVAALPAVSRGVDHLIDHVVCGCRSAPLRPSSPPRLRPAVPSRAAALSRPDEAARPRRADGCAAVPQRSHASHPAGARARRVPGRSHAQRRCDRVGAQRYAARRRGR